MEGSSNDYDPGTWQNLQNMQNRTYQLLIVWSIKTIRETSTPQDHHNNGEPMADSRLSIWFLR
jgi:hypothetical protein